MGNSLRFELGNVNILQNTTFHERLYRPDNEIQHITDILRTGIVPSYIKYPPFFAKTERGSELIGRFWSFANALADKCFEIPAILVAETNIETILQQDREEILDFFLQINRPEIPHRSSNRREVIKKAGGICPFCLKGYVRVYLNKKNELATGNGHYVHCDRNVINKESVNYGRLCDFRLKLTPHEYKHFVSGEIRIDEMMKAVVGHKQCKNNKPLYLRFLHWPDKIEVAERCRDYFSTLPTCTCVHYKFITEMKPKQFKK